MTPVVKHAVVLSGGQQFPVPSAATESSTGNSTSHVVSLPSGIVAGDRLVIVGFTSAVVSTSASGWTGIGATTRSQVLHKVADGGEGANVTVTTSGSSNGVWHAYRVEKGRGVEFSGAASIDPAAITPTWGTKKMLVIAFAGTTGTTTVSTYPTGYSGQEESSGTLTLGSAWRQVHAASEDPSTYAFTSAGTTSARTVAIEAR